MFVGTIASTHQMHAVLVGEIANRGYVLDVLTPYVIDGSAFGGFQLMATVDLQAIDVFVGVLGIQPAAMAKNN
jgi:hypothetical protein